MRRLLFKSIAEARVAFIGCALLAFLFAWVYVSVITYFQVAQFEAILDRLQGLERFWPVPFDQILTYPGRIALMFDDPALILCVVGFAIARGSDSVSGEIGRGTMEMLLAQPVSRVQIISVHVVVTLIGMTLVTMVAWAGLWVGINVTQVEERVRPTIRVPILNRDVAIPFIEPEKKWVPLREKVNIRVFGPAALNLLSLGICLAGLTVLMSSWDRYRWRTIGIVIGIYLVQLIIKITGIAAGQKIITRCSLFCAYEPQRFVLMAVEEPQDAWSFVHFDEQGRFADLGPLGYDSILILLGVAFLVAGVAIFRRRDIPAPL